MMNFPTFSPFRLWGEWIDHPTHDHYWDGLAVTPKLAAVKVPVLVISGWKDHLFRGGALHNYEMLVAQGHGDKTWLLAGPWEHELMDMPSGMVRAWFDYWLQERKAAPLPPARVVSYEGGDNGRGWQAFEQWPPKAASVVELALKQDGSLATVPGASGTRAFSQNYFSGLLWSEDTVAFTSDVLAADWVLAGGMAVELKARFSEPDANINAQLFELREGEERLIEQGWLKLSHRDSHVHPAPVTPNEEIRVRVPLWAVHQRIPAGSQLVLKLSGGSVIDLVSADSPVRTELATGEGGSTLRLTVLGKTE